MNAAVQQSSEAAIVLFVKKYKSAKKRKEKSEINKINKEIDDLSLTGFVISTITSMEVIPVDSSNIGLGSDKHGAGLAKTSHINKYCVNVIRNRRSIKNIKEVVDNYSRTQTKYSNE